MRILMLSHGYPPTVSGVTLVVQKISRALVQKDHQVLVVTASERREPYSSKDGNVQLERLRSFKNPYWSEGPIPWVSAKTLRRLIHRFKPDVIHTHENALLSFQLLRQKHIPGVPWISSCYYLPRYVTHYLPGSSPLKNWIEISLWKYGVHNLNQYDYAIFSTRTQQQEYLDHGLRTPSIAISNGVDNRRYYPKNSKVEEVERIYSLPPHPRILFVGRLMKDKKVDVLIRAMRQVITAQEAHLLVVGQGDERENLASQVLLLGLERNVHFLGYVPESDLPSIYRSSDLFSIASVCEVQSIPALQAVASGLPIVAVNAGALPELAQPGFNGLLVTPDDPVELGGALLRVVSNSDYSSQLGRASLVLAARHSEEETFKAYEEMYQDQLKKARKEKV